MRAMGWPDAFPGTDYGVKKTLAEASGPWHSYATVNLWNSL